ncbi:hypothetical protein EV421DRAFT_1743229 [Armillaria borealis]|uniref:Uncharacterized protein n=1 Tax=Armillaria borealis TaxID=47425 RepID=A0AA39IWV1_9AGAR|nr:hypothetical protein EV421DRAFT_1743229 [Armillaria borealis]
MLGRRRGWSVGALEFRQVMRLIEDRRTGRKKGAYPDKAEFWKFSMVTYKGWEAMRNEDVMNRRGCCLEISHSTEDVAHDSSWRESPLEESSGAAHSEKSSEHGCSSDDQCITINPRPSSSSHSFMSHIVHPVHTSHVEARQGMWDMRLRMTAAYYRGTNLALISHGQFIHLDTHRSNPSGWRTKGESHSE